MGNDQSCGICGISTVRIRMHHGVVRELNEVRFVHQLKKNLISVRTLEANGFNVTFETTKGSLVVMKGVYNKNLYYLKGSTEIDQVALAVSEADHLAGHLQREPHQPPPRTEPGVREFRYRRPPSFSGAEGPLAAEELLKVTETILTVTRIAPAEWVDLMDVQLTDTARIWWAAKKTHLERPILWETLTERFNKKYFPQSARDELLRRFVELKQGGRKVDEYEAESSSLSRYAPHLVTDPTIRKHQFQKGLDKYIRLALAGRALTSHDTVLDAAREIESVQKEPEDPHVVQSRTPVAPSQNVERPPLRQQQAPQRQQFSQRQPLHLGHPYQHPGVQTLGQPSIKCSYCSHVGHT
ncbi:uncharacterized protein LOC109821297 [Asparagus officinalis]|uniref:uncharacterized protein LOC109821297 n=1 Tax=Asparagus officinalis TaxID=4686 RepID=UPI00098DFA4C|nr:uncharacterized protein LOC109821297 [Asparagus officinalis]